MAYFSCKNTKITAIASAVPDDVEYTTDYIDLFGETYVKKFIASTGVERRYASHRLGVTASDLCFAAAEKIFKELNFDRSKVDALIFASSSRDYSMPVQPAFYRTGFSFLMNVCATMYHLDVPPMSMVSIWQQCTSIQGAGRFYYWLVQRATNFQKIMFLQRFLCYLAIAALLHC